MKKRAYDSALREGLPAEVIGKLWREWQDAEKVETENTLPSRPMYQINGFEHPPLYTLIKNNDFAATRFQWGLVPSWVKDENQANEIMNKTLNARGESIFEKAAFKEAAIKNRCLIFVDGYYEHHHYKGKTYPYFIQHKSENLPLVFGGLWAEWINKSTGEIVKSATIVTTAANELMAKIHNNPRANGARMPLILAPNNFEAWLTAKDEATVKSLIQPFNQEELKAYTVGKLKGKGAIPDGPESIKEKIYPELTSKELFD